jgi:ribulose-5-phosphate 4-epimerase/fuculose-1-phosphate aldolase
MPSTARASCCIRRCTRRILTSSRCATRIRSTAPHGLRWAGPSIPITQDAACFYEDHVVIKDEGGAVAVTEDAGRNVAAAFKNVRAAIHQGHGLLTASRHSIDDAAFWFIALERCCQVQLMVEATGKAPVMLSPEVARYSREHVGNEFIGWLHFQTIYGELVERQPEMFD